MMDILRHGHHVEVLEPPALRRAVMDTIGQLKAVYPDYPDDAGSNAKVAGTITG